MTSLIQPQSSAVHLKPSELVICREPCQVTTVLGSCVSVTMFNARVGLAAICHAMLPAPGQGHCPKDHSREPFKFVSAVVPAMVDAFRLAGIRPAEIEVKLFGGANCIARKGGHPCPNCVGPANVRMAQRLLQGQNLCIKACNVGGTRGRKIVFNTLTGEVLHKHLS